MATGTHVGPQPDGSNATATMDGRENGGTKLFQYRQLTCGVRKQQGHRSQRDTDNRCCVPAHNPVIDLTIPVFLGVLHVIADVSQEHIAQRIC